MALLRPHLKSGPDAGSPLGSDISFQDRTVRALAFVVEQGRSSAELLTSVAEGARVRCQTFEGCASLVDAMAQRTPDMVIVDVTTEGTDAVEVLHALSRHAYPGVLQLISDPGVPMVAPIRQLAELHALRVLTPLAKPLDAATIHRTFVDLKPTVSQARLPQIRLDEAIKNGWVQFWYQPKIDFRTKTLVGMEAFVRLFHPHKGLISPASALKNADERSLTALAHFALIETGGAGSKLSDMGLNPTIAINVSLKALQTVPVARIVRDYFARTGRKPNWIFDVNEEDIADNRMVVRDLDTMLRSIGIKLAVDNSKGTALPPAALKELPISEIKLSPSFVSQCDSKAEDAAVCKAMIDLAHSMQTVAVAIGVETGAQSQALQRMGCDVGQGFLFGQPLPLEQIIAMVRQRSVATKPAVARTA